MHRSATTACGVLLCGPAVVTHLAPNVDDLAQTDAAVRTLATACSTLAATLARRVRLQHCMGLLVACAAREHLNGAPPNETSVFARHFPSIGIVGFLSGCEIACLPADDGQAQAQTQAQAQAQGQSDAGRRATSARQAHGTPRARLYP